MAKVILITGCSSGFGNITARLLASKNFLVYAGVRKPADLKILEGVANLKPLLLDITWSQQKINLTIEEIIKKEGKIDVVINNAGFGFIGPVGDSTEAEIKDQFETNFFGQFRIIKSVLPSMREKNNGLIININTISGLISTAFYGSYSASKFALDALTTSLRFEESVYNIDFVSVYPGSFRTKFWENSKWAKGSPDTNRKVGIIVNKVKWHRGDANRVVKLLAKIIETKNPKKNYMVGFNAYLQYYFFKLVPYEFIDWFGKKTVQRISRWTIR